LCALIRKYHLIVVFYRVRINVNSKTRRHTKIKVTT
jgi:hypothetical protein